MKISMAEITRAINENEYAPEKKWQYETIELIDALETVCNGHLDRYEVTVKVKAGKYDNNGFKYQINHYVDKNAYCCYYNGACYLG